MSVTSKEIAEKVGVCRQAVSAVLNGRPGSVGPEKRKKILELARNLHYRPNPAALRLNGRKSQPFAVIDMGFTPPHKQAVMAHLNQLLAAEEYQVRLTPPGDFIQKIRMIYESTAEGAAGVFTDLKPYLLDVEKFPAPLVIFGNADEECDTAFDYHTGCSLFLDYAIRQNRTRIAFAAAQIKDGLSRGKILFQVLKEECAKHGLSTPEPIIFQHNERAVPEIMELIRGKGVGAVLCEYDAIGARLMTLLNARGVRIPEEILVAGCGCSYLTELSMFPMPSIILPVHMFSEEAMNAFRDRQKCPFPEKRIPRLVPTSFHIPEKQSDEDTLYWERGYAVLEDKINYRKGTEK